VTNSFYNASGSPATASPGYSAVIRSEFTNIGKAFDKMPPLTSVNKAVVVNSGGTGMTVTAGGLSLAGDFATSGGYSTTLSTQANVTVTLPATDAAMAVSNVAQTFTKVQTFSDGVDIISRFNPSQVIQPGHLGYKCYTYNANPSGNPIASLVLPVAGIYSITGSVKIYYNAGTMGDVFVLTNGINLTNLGSTISTNVSVSKKILSTVIPVFGTVYAQGASTVYMNISDTSNMTFYDAILTAETLA
jgi:hypothetical protein